MGALDGDLTPERRKGRTLSVSDPFIISAVPAISITGFDVAETTRFGNRLACDARRWMAKGGLAQDRRLSRCEAEHIWRLRFAGEVS